MPAPLGDDGVGVGEPAVPKVGMLCYDHLKIRRQFDRQVEHQPEELEHRRAVGVRQLGDVAFAIPFGRVVRL